ncbi:hypothetical protein [Limnovirga soli]|uniref:Uncharacterized protein n=1 Tax=Limnovirga soli TaxID=2656915 RepID=A0A8J8FEV0_9BACT|nr:hypothetical protein [Limnovirga soli]NNV55064.1 hypothetical protein [Limnovirga soli]
MFKKQCLTMVCFICSFMLHAQENAISVSNFTVKNQLQSNISEWGNTPGALLLVAQNSSWGDRPVKLLIAVKKGDSKICGIADGITLDYFKARSFGTNELLAGLGNCETLPPGIYSLCVQFRGMSDNRQWVNISPEVCKPFTVDGGTNNQKYTGPAPIFPENNKIFTEQDIKKPLTFRWTPVVPKPQEPVTYRLKVWQLMQGQNSTEALRTNPPIVTKDVDNFTQTIVANLLTGPCKPPYLCDFVWTVQAINREGKPWGENIGESEPSLFSVSSAGCGTNKDIVTITCKGWVNGLPTYNVSIVFNNVIPITGGQQCTTMMNGITATLGTISGINTLPVTIPVGGNSPAISFTYTPANSTQTAVTFNYTGIWNDGNNNTSNFNSGLITLPSCVCNSCDLIQWNIGTATQALLGNYMNIIQPFNPTGYGNIVGVKAEIITFERYVGDSCMSCNKDWNQWGNFTAGNYAGLSGSLAAASPPITGFTHHAIYFNATGPGSFNLSISTPPLSNLSCCCDRVAVTIRYTYTFKASDGTCTYCSFVKRYEFFKGNCRGIPVPIDTPVNPTK